VSEFSPDRDLEKEFEFNLSLLRKTRIKFEEIERGETKINNTDAKKLICSYDVANTGKVKALIYILIKNKEVYTIVFATEFNKFSECKSKFEEIAHSLQFFNW